MKESNINIGSEYLVNHCRKGKFFGRLEFYDNEWFVFVVTRGKAGAALAYNEKDVGEGVIVRKTFCSLTEVQLNNKSLRKDSSGRDLFRVVMTDGLKVKTIFIYAFNVSFAIEKAKNNHPYLTFYRARKETDDTGVQQ